MSGITLSKKLPDGNLVEVDIANVYNTKIEAYEYEAKEEEIVVILGAHKGGTMLKWAKQVGEFGKIIAVEAAPENFLDLLRNLTLNNYKNVLPLCFAIWNKDGREKMWYSTYEDHTDQAHSLVIDWSGKDKKDMVYTITWDTLVSILHLERVDYCKCNVEGAEIQFLEGMNKIFPKFLSIQFHKLNDKDVIELLLKKGYVNIRKAGGDWIYANSTR